jgi:hypothetical protein
MDGRHHCAQRDVQIVLVPYPAAGSPQPLKWAKPNKYPRQDRAPWRPATRPPNKASASKRLLDAIVRNEAAARQMLTPQPPSTMLTR